MNIAIIADPCDPKKPGGLGRCIFELAKAAIEAAPGQQFVVYSKSDFPVAGVEHKTLPGNVWLKGGSALRKGADLYVFFTPVIPLFFKPKRAIVVAEDFAYLELPRTTLREKYLAFVTKLMHKRSFALAEHVVCISEATKESAVKFFGVDPNKCSVVPLAAMPLAAPVVVADVPGHFFLFAGVLKDRKNVAALIRAFALFAKHNTTHDFAIAGRTDGEYYNMLVKLVAELGIEKRVQFLGHMSDAQMAYLYSKAEALVFATKVEGFGMPVAEAFTAGVPVITSNRGALAEVAADAALLADPDKPESIAEAMAQIVQNPPLRAMLIEKGKERNKEFSWTKSGALFAALFT